jgi:hypothetical protein
MSLLLISLVGLMLLVPPFAFFRALSRYMRSSHSGLGIGTRFVWFVVGLTPLLINLGYMYISWVPLAAGQLVADNNMAAAVTISWFSFWGRVALTRRASRRRRRMV